MLFRDQCSAKIKRSINTNIKLLEFWSKADKVIVFDINIQESNKKKEAPLFSDESFFTDGKLEKQRGNW